MTRHVSVRIAALASACALVLGVVHAQNPPTANPNEKKTSYMPVDIKEDFASIMARMSAAKAGVMRRQMDLLAQRYDLSNRAAPDAKMFRGKAVQDGVRAKAPAGTTWEQLAAMEPDQVRDRDLFPAGFKPLPHPNHPEGGMVFPRFHIDEINRQEQRDLTRFDLDFDIPEHFLP